MDIGEKEGEVTKPGPKTESDMFQLVYNSDGINGRPQFLFCIHIVADL